MTAKEYNRCVATCADDVMRFAVRCGFRREDCEDAVQEALASLWNHRESVAVDKGKSYLMGAAYRRLVSHFRHEAVVRDYAAGTVPAVSQMPDERFDFRDFGLYVQTATLSLFKSGVEPLYPVSFGIYWTMTGR